MTVAEIINECKEMELYRGELLRYLADCVLDAQLSSGGRVLDAMDFKEWLMELSAEANQETA